MKNSILLVLALILVPIAVISFKKKETNFNLPKNSDITVKVKNVDNNKVININLEEYIVGVVAAEMPALFEFEALKAQAVAARTYAYYKINHSTKTYDLLNNISDQGYITKEEMQEKWQDKYEEYYQKIKQAVIDTKKEVITYNDDEILAYYFSMSNGYTEDAKLVFEEQPYLESVESSWEDESINNFEVTTTYEKSQFCKHLNIKCNEINISNIKRTKSNRVSKILINGQEFDGITIRKLLDLRSTDFHIKLENNNILITTYGYGHGVGMSQYGANGMAKEGYNYKQILKHYYKDTKIKKISV